MAYELNGGNLEICNMCVSKICHEKNGALKDKYFSSLSAILDQADIYRKTAMKNFLIWSFTNKRSISLIYLHIIFLNQHSFADWSTVGPTNPHFLLWARKPEITASKTTCSLPSYAPPIHQWENSLVLSRASMWREMVAENETENESTYNECKRSRGWGKLRPSQ